MLHHIDTESESREFSGLTETLKGAKRILRPDGVMLITTVVPSQIKYSYWFTQLHPSAFEKIERVLLPAEQYLTLFSECGFQCVSSLSLLRAHTLTIFVDYLESQGPLDEDWRKGTNMFGNIKDKELLEYENIILNLKQKDGLKEFMKQHDRTPELGIIVLFTCIPA